MATISIGYDTVYTISQIVDDGGGDAEVTVSGGQGLDVNPSIFAGARVYIIGTSDATIDELSHEISSITDSTTLVLTTAYNETANSGTMFINPSHTLLDG